MRTSTMSTLREQRDVTPGQYVCLSITDTGVGMSPAVRARAFDPFFTTKPIGQGTGLGLSMIYGFVRQSEGHVRIYSEIGAGTTVKLYLPRYRGAVEERGGDRGDPSAEKAHDGETVLVIEDEHLGARTRRRSAQRSRLPRASGRRRAFGPQDPAISRAHRSSGQRIGLPGMNGRQVADAARQHRPDLKILFITGYAENAAMANGFLEPGMEMVTKPFAVDALAAASAR